jgi:hypothetical protein
LFWLLGIWTFSLPFYSRKGKLGYLFSLTFVTILWNAGYHSRAIGNPRYGDKQPGATKIASHKRPSSNRGGQPNAGTVMGKINLE